MAAGESRFLAPMVAAALLAVLLNFSSLIELQREGSTTEARVSASMRQSFTYVSWRMFLDRPLLGYGFGQFYLEKLPYLSDRSTPLQLELIRDYINHNTYLDLLAETGIVGFSLYMAVLGCWIRAGWRLTRPAIPCGSAGTEFCCWERWPPTACRCCSTK